MRNERLKRVDTAIMVTLGYCQSVHGLKGALKLNLENLEGRTLKKGTKVRLFPRNGKNHLPVDGRDFTVSNIVYGHKVMISFEGVGDRTSAERILPFNLKVFRNSLPDLPEDEVYLSDLEGQEVFDYEKGESFGELKGFYDHPGQSVAVIETKEKTLLEIPFVKTFFPVVEQIETGHRIEVIRPEVI